MNEQANHNAIKPLDLDLLAAESAQTIIQKLTGTPAKEIEVAVTKVLGVLQENGVYACALFLYAQTAGPSICRETRDALLALTGKLRVNLSPPQQADYKVGLKFVSEHVCAELDRLLLVKQLWEQTLIYTRYGAKARKAQEKHEEEEKKKAKEEAAANKEK